MKKTLFRFITISFCFVLSVYSQEYQDWKWLYPLPQGNTLTWVKLWDDNVCYAFGNGGTFMKSINGGTNWYFHHKASNIITQDGGSANILSAYFFDQSTGYTSGVGSVTKTTNGGINFITVPAFSSAVVWNDVYFVNNNTGFVLGHVANALGKTTDGGKTWNFISGTPFTGRKVYSPDGNTILVLVNENDGGSRSVVYRTTDSGINWSSTFLTSVNISEMDFCNATTGFVGGLGFLFLTTNTGINWTQVSVPTGNIFAVKMYQDSDSIRTYLAGPSNGIYYSNNKGITWSFLQYNDPLQTFSSRYYDLSRYNNTIYTVGINGLINKSSNHGANWNNLNYIPNDGFFYSLFAESGNGRVWVSGSETSSLNNGQILFSSSGGTNWIIQYTHPSEILKIQMVDLNTGYAAAVNNFIKTTNSGANWSPVSIPGQTSFSNLDFIDPNTGWVIGIGKISRTTNGASTWIQVPPPNSSSLSNIEFVDVLTGWISDGIGNLHFTSNGGQSWSTQINVINGVKEIKMFDNQHGYIITNFSLRKTTNSGSVWIDIPLPVSEMLNAMDWTDINNGIIGGQNGYAIKTINGGQSWQIINTNGRFASFTTSGGWINQIFMNHPDTAFAVGGFTNDFIFKYTSSLTNVLTWQNNVPKIYSLQQNYPNPFNPSTTIEFELNSMSNVSLKVYDITGRLVFSIIDGMKFNAGRIKYDFDGSNLSSGVYFYSLFIDNKPIDTKKMLLVK